MKLQKPLSEMTKEELWQLFPIFLTPHKECWKGWYKEEESGLKAILEESINESEYRLSHIGSTAIDGIWAKPIIDILLEIQNDLSMRIVKEKLIMHGYLRMFQQDDRMDFNKGYTPNGFAERVFHLHLRYKGDNAELYFRDYMRDNPCLAKQYEALKLLLWKKFEHDRDGYTDAKGEFISENTKKAKDLYKNRYE